METCCDIFCRYLLTNKTNTVTAEPEEEGPNQTTGTTALTGASRH
jgi:hypothetical protein